MNKIKYFQRGGKNLPTAPDTKEAYKGGTYKLSINSDEIIRPAEKFMSWIKPYFQQGGSMNQQQDIQQQIMKLVQEAILGNQEAIDKINQIEQAAQQGDPQAAQLKQMIQQVVEQMKGQATSAKWGSKLQYIKSLKYAKGGKTCPSCQNGGIPNNTKNNPDKLKNKIEEKACGGKTKKKYFGGWI